MARRLRPFVRAQILRFGHHRRGFEAAGGRMSFVPVLPIECAVEVCGYHLNFATQGNRFVESLAREPGLDFERNLEIFPTTGGAISMWNHSAELVIVREAIGDPTCRGLRLILDGASGSWPDGASAVASDVELRLVEPLSNVMRHCPIVGSLDAVPWF